MGVLSESVRGVGGGGGCPIVKLPYIIQLMVP